MILRVSLRLLRRLTNWNSTNVLNAIVPATVAAPATGSPHVVTRSSPTRRRFGVGQTRRRLNRQPLQHGCASEAVPFRDDGHHGWRLSEVRHGGGSFGRRAVAGRRSLPTRTVRALAAGLKSRSDDSKNSGYSPSPTTLHRTLDHGNHCMFVAAMLLSPAKGSIPTTALPPPRTAIGPGSPAPSERRDLRTDTSSLERGHHATPTTAHRRRRIASTAKRLLVISAGFTLCGAGLIMLVLPGTNTSPPSSATNPLNEPNQP